MANLLMHCGGKHVSRDELANASTPDKTKTWVPVSHQRLLELVDQTIEGQGFRVTNQAHGLWGNGSRYFGLLELAQHGTLPDYRTVIGIRNAHDKAFAAAVCLGATVVVCDNLSFAGDVTLSRKHTRHVVRDLPGLVRDTFLKFRNLYAQQEARIAGYKNTRIHDRTAHDLIVQAVDHEVIPVTKLPTVVSEWRKPSHNEFTKHGRSLWRLHNAFSESWKGANLNTLPRRSQRLHQLLDRVCGFQLAA